VCRPCVAVLSSSEGGVCSSSSSSHCLDQLAEVKEKVGDETPYCGYKMNAAFVKCKVYLYIRIESIS